MLNMEYTYGNRYKRRAGLSNVQTITSQYISDPNIQVELISSKAYMYE